MNVQETSKQAYFSEVLPTLSDRHQKVLEVLSTVPDATNNELSKMLAWEINRVTPRINELVNREEPLKPLVEQAGKRACRITGRTAIAWRVIKKPLNRRCTVCSKDAVKYYADKPVCLDHSPVAPSPF